MKKKSVSIFWIVVTILLILVVAVTLATNVLFSQSSTPKIFGNYIYMEEYDTMEATTAVATSTSEEVGSVSDSDNVDSTSQAASIHKGSAVIAPALSENDVVAKNNAVLCVLADTDSSADINEDRVAVRRIYNIEQDETGVTLYYPCTMNASEVGTEPAITQDAILGKCTIESPELYAFVKFATGMLGILTLLVLPCVLLVIMLIVKIARAGKNRDDDYDYVDEYDSNDVYDDYDDENDGYSDNNGPLFQPENTASRRRYDDDIADNFSRKPVNQNSPYQQARTQQFQAQTDVPIYTNPEDQIQPDGTTLRSRQDEEAAAALEAERNQAPVVSQEDLPLAKESYQGSHSSTGGSNVSSFGSRRRAEEGRGSERTYTPRSSTYTSRTASKPSNGSTSRSSRVDNASVDDLLAMIEDEKRKK